MIISKSAIKINGVMAFLKRLQLTLKVPTQPRNRCENVRAFKVGFYGVSNTFMFYHNLLNFLRLIKWMDKRDISYAD